MVAVSLRVNRTIQRIEGTYRSSIERVSFLAPLFARITLAVVFIAAGWRKVHDLHKVTETFTGLGIPYPAFNATLVGWCELVGGALLLVGLLTRLATIPLIITMIVAIATVKIAGVHSVVEFFALSEFGFIALLLYLATYGAGALSLDAVLGRAIARPVEVRHAGLRERPA